MDHSSALSITEDAAPTLIADRYLVEAELAHGGMGVVYRARDQSSGQHVAIKRLLPQRANKPYVLELFQSEYRTLASLKHPRIIAVYDYGLDEAGPYYTMELLNGRDFRAIAPLPYREAATHLRDVASSLALLHARRLVHRDVSSTNVRLTHDGRAKLLDFGALAPFGKVDVIMGTPSSTAPEALDGSALDQRADLYSLGALGYWLLTGRHAYPAKTFDMLRSMWRSTPALPSELVEGLPVAFEQLIMSLLSLDPLARPESAAEVIDRLNAIADLEPEEDAAGPRSYLLSSSTVGREQEVRQLRRRLMQLEDGQGSTVSIEGTTGIGKTRLLSELGVEARLRGFPVLQISARQHEQPYGVARALGLLALSILPKEAEKTLARHLPVLGHTFPELMRSEVALLALDDDPVERRLRTLSAFTRFLVELSERRPFVVAIDDAEHIDASSLALLAALTHGAARHRILVVVTLHAGSRGESERALSVLRGRAEIIRLRELRSEDTAQLAQMLFGQAPNTGRLASWLHELSGGNPMQCLELAAHLLSQQVIRYVQGTWVLPQELSPSELPLGVEQAREKRIARLSMQARSLAEILSLYRGVFSENLCCRLAEVAELGSPSLALHELESEGILLRGGQGYLFAQEPLREAFDRGLLAERRKLFHHTIGQVLIEEQGLSGKTALEAGFHLMHAGDLARGTKLLESGAEQLAMVGEGLRDAIPAFEAVLRVYRAQGRTFNQCLPILRSLVVAGQAADRRLIERYGEITLQSILELTGLNLARRLRPFVGRRTAVYTGLLYGALRFVLTPKRFRLGTVTDLFVHSFGVVVLLVASHLSLMEPKRIATILRGTAPLGWLPKGQIGRFLYDMCTAFHAIGVGRDSDANDLLRELSAQLADPSQLRDVSYPIKQRLRGGVILARGISEGHLTTAQGLPQLEELEALNLSFYNMGSAQLSMLFHANRGEMQQAHTFREQVELLAVQGGSTWQMEIFLPTTLAVIYDLTRDLVGLKRTVEQLDRVSREVPALLQHRDLQKAAYLGKQGRSAEAISLFEKVFATLRTDEFSNWGSAHAQYAEALNEAGEHARAKQICLSAAEHLGAKGSNDYCFYDLITRQLALAEAGLGDVARASQLLEDLIVYLAPRKNPLKLGLAHRDRALVALQCLDRETFEQHVRAMERWFRATANPALVGQYDRVRAKGVSAGLVQVESAAEAIQLKNMIERHDGGPERVQAALELVTRMTGSAAGYYYVVKHGELCLQGSVGRTGEPPELVQQRIRELSPALLRDAHTTGVTLSHTGSTSTSTASEAGDGLHARCGVFALQIPEGPRLRVVGALALLSGRHGLQAPSYQALLAIARALTPTKVPRG